MTTANVQPYSEGDFILGMALILVRKVGIPDIGAGEGPEISKISFNSQQCEMFHS